MRQQGQRSGQERFMGRAETQNSRTIVQLVFLRRPDAEPKKGIRSLTAIALTAFVSKWYATCVVLRKEEDKEPEELKKVHVCGVNGICCQHLQVLMTHLPHKQWEWQEHKDGKPKHGVPSAAKCVRGQHGHQGSV